MPTACATGSNPVPKREEVIMLWFVSAHALVWCFACIAMLIATWSQFRFDPGQAWVVLGTMAGAAATAGWLAAEGVQFLWPRRVLDPRVRRWWFAGALGAGAGLLGVILMAGSLIALQEAVPDLWVTTLAGALSAGLTLATTERVRRGACIHCGYDQSAATPAGGGICPECGAAQVC